MMVSCARYAQNGTQIAQPQSLPRKINSENKRHATAAGSPTTKSSLFEVPINLPLAETLELVTAGPPAQAPVDSASYQTGLSPGSLFSIFGPTNWVNREQTAGSSDLPTTMNGVMVSINGRPAPLLYVGPNQINGQIPYETAASGAIAQVIANGISAAQIPFTVSSVAPRIFSGEGNLCISQNDDGTLNASTNPAKAGRYIGAYLVGIGAVTPSVSTGAPARSDPHSIPPGPVSALLGGRSVIPTFLGLVPGAIGLAVVDMAVPSDLASGLHSLSITFGNATSNSCQIAVGQ